MLLIAPTEHSLHAILQPTAFRWRISSLPERHGCDIFSLTKRGIVGFQRKTLPDLVASLQDGRLYYELNQLITSGTVGTSFIVVESNFATTVDCQHYTEADISVSGLRSIVAKFHYFGIGFIPTYSTDDTLSCCISVSSYLASGKVGAVHRPKQNTDGWGRITSKSYGTFLLQSFPGIGPKVAEAIYDHFGTVPLAWSVTAADLALVPGIGRKRAESLMASLAGPTAAAGPTPA